MSDKLKGDGTPVGATAVNMVNGKTGPTVVLYGDDIGAPGTGPSALGCVKAGTNIAIAADGTISASGTIGSAWTAVTGKPFETLGTGLSVTGGALNVTGGGGSTDWKDITNKPTAFTPTPANGTTLGGVKQGTNITIASDGTISATGSLGTDWSNVTNKPFTSIGSGLTVTGGVLSANGGGGSVDWTAITNKPSTFPVAIGGKDQLGGFKVGAGLNVQPDGTLSAQYDAPTWAEVTGKPATFPVAPATKSALGGVIAGTGVNIDGSGVISVNSATPSWNDITGKPATFTPPIASDKVLGGVKEGAGINIEADGTINTVQAAPYWNEVLDKPAVFPVAIATNDTLGGVIAGNGVSIAANGEISVRTTPPAWNEVTDKPEYFPPVIASSSVVGGVKSGTNISIDPDGTINAAAIDIPIASSYTLGAIKVGNGLTIQEDGTLGTEAAAPYWTEIVGKPDVYPPSVASDGVVGGIMPDDNFTVSPSGLLSGKPFTGRPFAVVQYDDTGKIIPSYTAENRNGNLTLGGVQPTTDENGKLTGEEVTFGGQLTILDKSGKYKLGISNDSLDYDIAFTNGPNIKTGFLPFVTNVVGEVVSVAFGSIVDAIGYATGKKLGVVQVGQNIDVDSKGVISVKTADKSNLGLMIAGDNLNVNKGVVTPAIATTASPGIVQIGKGLEVDANGVINTTDAVGFLNRRVFENNTYYEKDYDWTLPEGVEYFRVTVVGGGGTGGGWSNNANEGSGGAGGGGGAYSRAMFYGYKFKAGDAFKVRVGCSNYKGLGDGTESYFRLASKASSYLYCEGGKGGESGYVQGSEKKGFTKPGDGGVVKTDGFDGAVMFNLDAVSGGNGLPGLSVTTPHGPKTVGGAGGSSFLGTSGGTFPTSGYGTGAGGAGEANNSGGGGGGYVGRGGVVIIEY